MVSTGYTNVGEEWAQKLSYRTDLITRDTGFDVLLYNDTSDSLSDASDIGDVTTEPTDGNYTRQTLTLDSANFTLSVESGDLRAEGTVTFDVTNTTGTVDAWGAVVDFQSDVVNSETGQNPHLIATAALDNGDQDLSALTSLEVTCRIDLT